MLKGKLIRFGKIFDCGFSSVSLRLILFRFSFSCVAVSVVSISIHITHNKLQMNYIAVNTDQTGPFFINII